MARRPDRLSGPAAARAARTRAQAATWAWAGKVASRLGRFRPDRAQPSMEIGRPSAPSGGSKGTRGRRSPKTLVHSFPPLLSLAPHATAAAAVVSVGADEGWCRPSLSGSPSFLSRASLSQQRDASRATASRAGGEDEDGATAGPLAGERAPHRESAPPSSGSVSAPCTRTRADASRRRTPARSGLSRTTAEMAAVR